jgi:hypothetical protein
MLLWIVLYCDVGITRGWDRQSKHLTSLPFFWLLILNSTDRSILELQRMIGDVAMSIDFEPAFRLATVAYCGLVVQDKLQDETNMSSQ